MTSLTIITVRRQLNVLITDALFERDEVTPFIPKNVIRSMAHWIFRMNLTGAEKEIASRMTKDILLEYERRIRLVRQELDQEVFHRFGGENGERIEG